ncbi:MAG: ABC transporter ATP-binding protein/permease [Firmicutes bacterium]|nr:ABC transporter ATP-binding protein/permease [Bacillota bacterium]
MAKLLKHLKPYALQVFAVFTLVLGQVMADLELPDLMAKIVNEGIIGQDNSVILNTGFWMLLIALSGAACSVGVGFLSSRIATGFSMNLREKVFSKVEGFSLKEFDRFSTASLITRSTNDIQQIQILFVMLLRMVLTAPLMGFGAIIKAYDAAPSMTWIIALVLLGMVGITLALFSIAMPKFRLLQELVDRLNLVTRQNLTGLRVVRAFNAEKFEEANFERANANLTKVSLYVNRLTAAMQPMMMLLLNFIAITVIWVGSHEIDAEHLMVGDMIAFMQYAMQVVFSFLFISFIFMMLPRALVSAQRVAEVIETEPTVKDPEHPIAFPANMRGVIEFKNVSFYYSEADSPVLKDISFTAHPGEITAFIGSTGSGKSTLINLILRFYDVSDGQVLVNGIDVRLVKQKDLRDMIGYVPQKAVLFSGTVCSNIKYGAPEASDEEMQEAARIAQASEFIENFDTRFESPIAQSGANISGGQKQRLAIARAIIKKPQIYIFDDSFSALDFRTDAALREELSKEIKGATVLIVAQRISTIIDADKIIVLDEGRIVGTGTHTELMKSCDIYREIAFSQLSEEELKSTVESPV